VVLGRVADAGERGRPKRRPAVIIARLGGDPPSFLLAAISSDTSRTTPDWDQPLAPGPDTGLAVESMLRPGFLGTVAIDADVTVIGRVDPAILATVRARLRAALA
jgi:hypothetical protein